MRGWVLGVLLAETASPSFWADPLVSGNQNILACLSVSSSRRTCLTVPAKTCAALALLSLGRRLWAGLGACGPFINEKPSRSAGDCLGPLQNKQTTAQTEHKLAVETT